MLKIVSMKNKTGEKNEEDRYPVIADMMVDNKDELPNVNDLYGYTLWMGSSVYVIESSETYVLGSDGEWYKSKAGGVSDVDSLVTGQSENPVKSSGIYEFVNSSVSTNTAYFKGTFYSRNDLENVPDPTNNDYAFLVETDDAGNTVYNRYKYNGKTWVFEYSLNNSSFTANQWASINSGITADDVAKISDLSQSLTNKVDKVDGKQLSTNDYTNEDKTKLSSLPTIVKLNSMEEFDALTDKTAEFYFIKEG